VIDIHTHILPGIDDGAQDQVSSIAICRGLVAGGVKSVFATPHQVLTEDDQVTAVVVDRLCAVLQAALAGEGIVLELHSGAEVYVEADTSCDDLLSKGIRMGPAARYLLMEFSWGCFQRFDDTKELLSAVLAAGVIPIIAHPERYAYFAYNRDVLHDLVTTGVVVQVTTSALVGCRGRSVRRLIHKWLTNGLVHMIASDVHVPEQMGCSLQQAWDALAARYSSELADLLLSTNPGKVIRGEQVESPQALVSASRVSWLSRFLRH